MKRKVFLTTMLAMPKYASQVEYYGGRSLSYILTEP